MRCVVDRPGAEDVLMELLMLVLILDSRVVASAGEQRDQREDGQWLDFLVRLN